MVAPIRQRFLFIMVISPLCAVLLYGCWTNIQTFSCANRMTKASKHRRPKCSKLFENDKEEILKFRDITTTESKYSNEYKLLTNNCLEFLTKRKYIQVVTKDETNFPIAFSVIMFKDFEQFERLLRSIYRPSNYYCIHVDAKAETSVRQDVSRLASCLPHVFIPNRPISVVWGRFSVLEAELVCMQELLKYKAWRYFINLTGQEYPLKTNRQLVEILRMYNGSNDIEGTIKRVSDKASRWGRAGKPPHNIRPVKGAVHIVASRQFVDYALNNPVANDLLRWVKQTKIPDETFFATLNHNPQLRIPGTYAEVPETHPVTKPFLARYKIWKDDSLFRDVCLGKYVRGICIFGVGDLHKFPKRKELFANKFHFGYQPATLDCMDEWYDGLVQREMNGTADFNSSYYRTLGFIQNQVKAK